jgi:hypothetical protein
MERVKVWFNCLCPSGIRSKEHDLLQRAAYCQSLSISMAPTVPVISTIITFLAHISAGNNLTAAQVKCNLIACAVLYHVVSVCYLFWCYPQIKLYHNHGNPCFDVTQAVLFHNHGNLVTMAALVQLNSCCKHVNSVIGGSLGVTKSLNHRCTIYREIGLNVLEYYGINMSCVVRMLFGNRFD